MYKLKAYHRFRETHVEPQWDRCDAPKAMPQNAEHLPVNKQGKADRDSVTKCNHSIKATQFQSKLIEASSLVRIARNRINELHGRFRLDATSQLLHGKVKDDAGRLGERELPAAYSDGVI